MLRNPQLAQPVLLQTCCHLHPGTLSPQETALPQTLLETQLPFSQWAQSIRVHKVPNVSGEQLSHFSGIIVWPADMTFFPAPLFPPLFSEAFCLCLTLSLPLRSSPVFHSESFTLICHLEEMVPHIGHRSVSPPAIMDLVFGLFLVTEGLPLWRPPILFAL